MELLTWRGGQEWDSTKCWVNGSKPGPFGSQFVWQGEVLDYANGRMWSPDACCEICTREPKCTHFTEGLELPVNGNPTKAKCILFSKVWGQVPYSGDVRSGVSRKEPHTMYLGRWPAAFQYDLNTSVFHQQKCEGDWVAHLRELSHLRDSPKTVLVPLPAAPSAETGRRCEVRGMTRLPHRGRWVQSGPTSTSVTRMSDGINPDQSLLHEFCGGAFYNPEQTPSFYVGPVEGPISDRHVGSKWYYWQPYVCDYVFFSRAKARQCLAERGLTRFAFVGDSLLDGAGTGFPFNLYELISGLNRNAKSGASLDPDAPSSYANQGDGTFRFRVGSARDDSIREETEQLLGSGGWAGIDVFLTDFALANRLMRSNMTELRQGLALDADFVARSLAPLPPQQRPRLYYLTAPTLHAERESHTTLSRAAAINAWMQENLTPRGWIQLDYFQVMLPRGKDSTCIQDGMHPHNNVRNMMVNVMLNHLCYA